MSKRRTAIPNPVRRGVLIEAGYRCTVLSCDVHAPSLELHHIDGDPSNHDPDNLLPVCPTHHTMIEAKTIDRQATIFYKSMSKEKMRAALDRYTTLITKQEFHQESMGYLSDVSTPYRTMFVGPLFAHPDWCFELTRKKRGGTGYDQALHEFLMRVPGDVASDVRIICRNSDRYIEILKTILTPEQLNRFKRDALDRIDQIWSESRSGWPQICCVDTGFFQLPTLHRDVAFITYRPDLLGPMAETRRSTEKDYLAEQKKIFDTVFEKNFGGIDAELAKLKDFIENLDIET